MTNPELLTGRVTKWNSGRRFGLLRQSAIGDEFFFHCQTCRDVSDAERHGFVVGQIVGFIAGPYEGRIAALDVHKINRRNIN